MPRVTIPVHIKVSALSEALCLHADDAKRLALKYGVTERSLYNWHRKVLDALPFVLSYDGRPRRRVPRHVSLERGRDETVKSR